jgi:L-alanine-DL-glutamate epimerase-like enolase superfamily enzyme
MKVKTIEVYLVSGSVTGSLADSTRKIGKVGYVVVRMRTDDGLEGIGITYHEVGGEAIRQLIIKDLSDFIIGRDPLETEVIWEQIFHFFRGVARKGLAFCALSVLDIALWDLKGKALALPLYKLLGGNKRQVPIYASGGWTSHSEKQLIAEMQFMVNQGYTKVKMKVGVREGTAPNEDLERVKAVRTELGPNVGIMLDANNAFKSGTAKSFANRVEDCDIYFFEEPVLADDMEGLACVRQSTNIPIGTGEHEYTKYGVRDLIINKAVDIVQVDVTRCGGITEYMKIAAMTQAWNLSVAPHGMEYMHMHLVAAVPNGLTLERLLLFENVNDLVFENAPQPKNGYLDIPDLPGLGLTLNEANLKKYNE